MTKYAFVHVLRHGIFCDTVKDYCLSSRDAIGHRSGYYGTYKLITIIVTKNHACCYLVQTGL